MQKPLLLIFISFLFTLSQGQTDMPASGLFTHRSHSGELLAAGISDPSLDSTVAVDQARFRAKMMLALMKGMVLGELTTINMGNENINDGAIDSDFEILYTSKFIGKIPDSLIVEYTNEEFTENGEAVVFASFANEIDSTQIVDSTGVSVIVTRSVSLEPKTQRWAVSTDKLEISAKDTGGTTLLYDFDLSKRVIESFIQFYDGHAENKRITGRYYTYEDRVGRASFGETTNADIRLKNSASINNGIWPAYLETIGQELCIAASLMNSKQNLLVSSGIDNTRAGNSGYTKTEFYQSAKNLSFNSFTFGIQNLNIQNNHLSMEVLVESTSFNGNLNVSPSGPSSGESLMYIRQLQEEGWKTLEEDDFEATAGSIWELQQGGTKNIYTNASAVAANRNTATLMSLEIAKLQLAALHRGHRFSIVSSNTGTEESETLQSAKTVTKAELEGIYPYYFLHRKLGNGLFEVQVHVTADFGEEQD